PSTDPWTTVDFKLPPPEKIIIKATPSRVIKNEIGDVLAKYKDTMPQDKKDQLKKYKKDLADYKNRKPLSEELKEKYKNLKKEFEKFTSTLKVYKVPISEKLKEAIKHFVERLEKSDFKTNGDFEKEVLKLLNMSLIDQEDKIAYHQKLTKRLQDTVSKKL
ncbi:MAG: hypothetical protein JWO53_825, partial [Chlamydiia bacterium]|nr:hypothetical protein [Chlamydiia bacterium]